VPGAVIIVLVLVIGIPVAFLITMGVVALVLGWTITSEVDEAFEGTEDLAISRM
jgi:flagellar biosynthesis component FlhA